jgi:FkbM family methyltransferase
MATSSSNEAPVIEWLDLPPVERALASCGPYGAIAAAAEYCRFKEVPAFVPANFHWEHGWNPSHWEFIHPDKIIGVPTSPDQAYWVARKDEAEYMRNCGYGHVEAIGLPIVYVRRPVVPRRRGSLLVMPAHSLDYTTHQWRFDEYAEQIDAIRSDFSAVVVCIHPSCWRHGYWVDAFRKRGFTLVQGALHEDRNALLRICTLLGGFEYVTTNSFGSQIAYAAYLGAKVSVFGPYAEYKAEDYANTYVYRLTPQILLPTIQNASEKSMRKHLPELFCHPLEAKERIEWGRREVGEDNRVSPGRLRSLFGWDWRSRFMRRLSARVPSKLKHVLKLALDSDYQQEVRKQKEKSAELERLACLPRHHATTTTLLGAPFDFNDASCFLALHSEIWERELYRFHAETETPVIIDGGANIGVSVIYFKRQFPRSRVLAFEPDPETFKVLARNCQQFGLEDVELYCEALWSRAGELRFKQEEEVTGRVNLNGDGHGVRVSGRRLRDLLDRDVDMLKLDIEGSETEVLRDCAAELNRVKNMVVEYHSYQNQPQSLDEITGILKASGFRVYVESDQWLNKPLLWRPVRQGMDLRLKIFAYRMPQNGG